jgi:starch synthase
VRALRVLYVASEVFPLAKAGGLADVSAALPVSLRDQGIDIQLLMPGYPRAMDLAGKLRLATVIENPLGVGHVRIWRGTVPSGLVPVWLVECQSLYTRHGNPYQDEQGRDFPDNALRFSLLSYIGAMIGMHSIGMPWCPDVIHVNDWQTALLPTMLHLWPGPHPPTVLAIHNLAHQGVFQADVIRRLPVPTGRRIPATVECKNEISFLQTGILSADRIVTVSPTYAAEVQTPEYGCGLDDVLHSLKLPIRGILNGVDDNIWNLLAILPHRQL